ncbi:tRNA (guanosine(37)-N1)-methyltransferase TrmD [Carboxydothermus hydrogenoformans]|uniref:tRNA (guanine-N(1)-)-methyltransferase n=1 Tax=Carboxydothermus hydrogenoformans (strain ATCC BAA-161 / DSM 6008 / Z-2901) TaxID=246194 RepID=TRMD_CARHZ|nr:tRNA (guanosine(37)-N1)-methyltransferase TrmD [Carboxydothermus hydrogenoformans]Q3AC72.1 RecName: Full=tRNA (guanine-N(1)-)-methyltransferase; AltName: Full=M1G-methyltransferase; AltName: Full=tRNA [GM37] methyltransferase [Carboxydothermus hydrogenoformans Z-2901]ABB16148.1 tRNA (guanine-N1)-methyltransferase [Carboxydothermus hydrogenoformans Z-2901]
MKIDILTLFPEMFYGPLNSSILKKAQEKGIITINYINIRDFTTDRHHQADDKPYGGGAGMVMKVEPIIKAYEAIPKNNSFTIMLSPQGRKFNQKLARELSQKEHLIFICGHYEGIDERVRQLIVDEEISIGDYILTGGEIAAMVIIDAVARLVPGVLGDEVSAEEESFSDQLLEYPHYTRPRNFRGLEVPEVLLSGNHKKIDLWRKKQSLLNTLFRRRDLLKVRGLTKEEKILLWQGFFELAMLIDEIPERSE